MRIIISDALRQGLLGQTDALGHYIAQNMSPPEGCDDWEYRDLPWMDRATWNVVVPVIGLYHLRVIALTEKAGRRRCQLWVSPEGCERLKAIAERRPN